MKLFLVVFCSLLPCFIQVANGQARLIGAETPVTDPNSVAILFNENGRNICSGVLIQPQWVLTTASCGLRGMNERLRVIIGGQVNLDFYSGINIYEIHIHPGFNGRLLDNDIALVHLQTITPGITRHVKVSEDQEDIVGTRVYALGYGNNNNGEILGAGTLRQKRLNILDNTICMQYPVPIDDDRLCTYESRACEGDQGGPLLSEDKKTVFGLISITPDQAAMCGGTVIPVTTYTRVSPYRDWITNITNILYV